MKLGTETVEQTLNETFKPIVTPLEKIVGMFVIIKIFNPVREEQVKIVGTENIDDDNYLSFNSADDE